MIFNYKNTVIHIFYSIIPYVLEAFIFPSFGYYNIVWTCLYLHDFSPKFLFGEADRFLEGQLLSLKEWNFLKLLRYMLPDYFSETLCQFNTLTSSG